MKKLLTFLTLLTLFFTTTWAETLTFTPTKASSSGLNGIYNVTGTLSDAPTGVNYECTTTYTNYNQLTGGKIYTLKIKGFTSDYKLTGIALDYRTNASSGAGTLNAKLGTTSVAPTYNLTKDGGTTPRTATMNVTETTFNGDDLIITVQATANSVYIIKFTITYGDNNASSVAQPTITLSPEGPYYEGDDVTATIACATEGATIYYKLNNDDNWTEYSSALTLTETTTIHAKAVLGTDESSEKTQTVTFKKSVANIAAFKALSDADAADFKFTGDVVVTYFNENDADYLWIKDNTGSTLLYQSNLTSNVEQGMIIAGGWHGMRAAYKGLIEIKNVNDASIAQGSETVNPVDYAFDDVISDNQAVYSKLSGVTITDKDNNGNFTITDADNNEINGHDTYGLTWPTGFSDKIYNITGIVSVYNDPQFIPVDFEEVVEDPGDGYYLVGNFNMDGNNWVAKDARYKFNGDGTSLTLNNVTLPDDVQFKIVKWEGETQTWYGGLTDDENQQNPYGLHRNWHTDIPLTNSYGNNYVKNFFIAGGAVTNFTLDTENLKFTVQRDAQLYFKCDKINNWEKIAMTATETGWTYSRELEAGAKFGFSDEWGDHHGNDWTLKPEHFGYSYDIPVGTENTYIMQDAGNYKLDVNSDLTVLHVNKVFNINCSANPNGGGTVVAKVNDQTVQSAMSGETVTIEYTTNNGYTFNNITLNGTVLEATEGVYSFVMPSQDAEVVANYTAQSFSITVESEPGEFGTVTCPETATTGQTVTFTVTPNEGYEVLSVTAYFVNGENNTTVPVSYNEETEEYSFGMPPFPVTVKVTYKAPLQPCTIRFEESWPNTNGSGGNDDTWATSGNSPAAVSQNPGWIYKDGDTEFQGYGANNCIRIGKRNGAGSATTPEIIVTNGTIYKMTFRAGGWTSDNTTINLSAEGAELYSDANCTTSVETETITNEAWTEFEVYVKATSSLMRITWAAPPTRSRFFLDDVVIDYFETPTPTELTLAQIIALGENADGKLYKISNEDGLLGVYKNGTSVWFKDEDQAVDYQNPTAAEYQYYTVVEKDLGYNISEKDFAQNNWIEVVFPSEVNYTNAHVSNLTGTYSCENGNPKLVVSAPVESDDVNQHQPSELIYELNPYMAANFVGSQKGYFFSEPKAQEYAQILWAVYKGNNEFEMPTGDDNYYGFEGSFTINLGLNKTSNPNLVPNSTYNFKAIIRKSASKAGPYEVYPTDLEGVSTAINGVEINGDVKSVKYVNVAGMVSDVPFQGVNIVVTEYTDGSRTTTKMLKK